MTEKTYMAGFGGQGVISLGQMWVYCGMKEGLNVTFFPFYGAEKRGGIARASVIVSDKEIASPIVAKADTVVVMSEDSVGIAEEKCRQGGTILLNSSLVKRDPNRPDAKILHIPCNEIAEKIGDGRIANMVMMGACLERTGILDIDSVVGTLSSFIKARKTIPLNQQAILKGAEAVR